MSSQKQKAAPASQSKDFPENAIGISGRFAAINRLITRDVNNARAPTFTKYTKDNIASYLANPYRFEKELRNAVNYIYGASPHFRRLIQYFVGLSDLAYVVSPHKIDPRSANLKTVSRNYRKVLGMLSGMNIESQFRKILTVCLREDTFYGTMWITGDSVIIQQLPAEYCTVATIEDNVLNVTFDFTYFNANSDMLKYYPPEFSAKYEQYKANRKQSKIELDAPTSFAIKCNSDILTHPIPPFAGVLRDVYDLEDYRDLKMTKTTLENYAMLVMQLGINAEGDWTIDLEKAKAFWRNLDSVLPEEVGSVLSPMPISKISFEKSNTGDTDTIGEAEQNLFTSAGVSSLLFNNDKASANALLLSIKADQAITYGIVKSIEDMVNRFIWRQPYGKTFKVTFLDCSPFNRKELQDHYLKACQYGIPMISYFAAASGLNQSELDGMSYLENEVLGLHDMFRPLQSSSTMSSSESNASSDEGGAPEKDIGDLSDSREANRENE